MTDASCYPIGTIAEDRALLRSNPSAAWSEGIIARTGSRFDSQFLHRQIHAFGSMRKTFTSRGRNLGVDQSCCCIRSFIR